MTDLEHLLKDQCRRMWRKHNADGTVTDLGWSEFEDLWRVWKDSYTWRHVSDDEAERIQRARAWNPRIDSTRGRRNTATAPLSPKTIEHVRGLHHRRNRVIKPMKPRIEIPDWMEWSLIGAMLFAGAAFIYLGLRMLGVI